MNRKKFTTAAILSAGLVLGATSIHNAPTNHKLLAKPSNNKNVTDTTTKNNSVIGAVGSENISTKSVSSKEIQNKALADSNNGIQLAYIGGANNTVMTPGVPNYSFAVTSNSSSSDFAPANTLTFASPLQKKLYEYLSNPVNQKTTMDTAVNLHNGNPDNTCVLFQSSALRAVGFNIPMSTAYTTVFAGNLLESGWQRHTNFNNLQPGDICFAYDYHTFMFMGWYNKSKKIAYVMGDESYADSSSYRDRHINGQTANANDGYNAQYAATCFYTYGGEPTTKPVLTGQIIGNGSITTQPGAGNTIGQVYYGQNVTVLDQEGYYYKVNINGTIGWVYAVNLLPTGTTNQTDTATSASNNTNTTSTSNNNNNSNNTSSQTNTNNSMIQITSPIGLWLLQGPSMSSSEIEVMPYNTQVKVISTSGDWTQVSYNGQTGWCYTAYTSPVNSSNSQTTTTPVSPNATSSTTNNQTNSSSSQNGQNTSSQTTTVTSPIGLWLLGSPSLNGSQIDVMPDNTKVEVLGSSGVWTKVNYNGQIGWCYTAYTSGVSSSNSQTTSPSKPQKSTNAPASNTTSSNTQSATATVNSPIGLWLLQSPSMGGSKIQIMPYNSNIQVLSQSGNWTQVSYNGQTGWCYTDYITMNASTSNNSSTGTTNNSSSNTTAPASTPVASNSSIGTTTITSPIGLWMLSSPSLNGSQISVIPYGTKVNVYAQKGGWVKVEYNGNEGWSYEDYTSGLDSETKQSMKEVISPVGLWLLQSPSLNANTIEIMPYKSQLTVLAQNGDWTKVIYNGTEGWCYTKYTQNI